MASASNVAQAIAEIKETGSSLMEEGARPDRERKRKRKRKGQFPSFNEVDTNVFNPEEYHAEELVESVVASTIDITAERGQIQKVTASTVRAIEVQRQWLDNIDYQREDHIRACQLLNIADETIPRMKSMLRSLTLKFWQPVCIAALIDMMEIDFMKGAILSDSVGLGKTWEALGVILHTYEKFISRREAGVAAKKPEGEMERARPFLIVVPPNLIYQWAGEIDNFTRKLKVFIYHGDSRAPGNITPNYIDGRLERTATMFNGKPEAIAKVVITSYQTLNNRHGSQAVKTWCHEQKQPFDDEHPTMPSNCPFSLAGLFNVAVWDEAHILRNPLAHQSLAAHWLDTTFNLLLTATPLFKGVHDLRGYAPLIFKRLKGEEGATTKAVLEAPGGSLGDRHLYTMDALDKFLYAKGIDEQEQGMNIRRIFYRVMIRRTLSSRLPFVGGRRIGDSIPGSQRQRILVGFDLHESDTYKNAEKRHKKGLFVQDDRDASRSHWNMAKLRKLVLISSWLGFIFLRGSLNVQYLSGALVIKEHSNQFLVIVNGSGLQALFALYNVHQEYNRTIIDFDSRRLEGFVPFLEPCSKWTSFGFPVSCDCNRVDEDVSEFRRHPFLFLRLARETTKPNKRIIEPQRPQM